MQVIVHRTSPSEVVDEQGNFEVSSTSHELVGFVFAPGSPDEAPESADVAAEIYGPYGADVLPTDLVECGGETFSVHGLPEQWMSAFGTGFSGCRIKLKRVA